MDFHIYLTLEVSIPYQCKTPILSLLACRCATMWRRGSDDDIQNCQRDFTKSRCPWSVNPQCAEAELIRFNIVNIMVADALATCHGFLYHHVISTHDIDYVELVGSCFTWWRISTICVISVREGGGGWHKVFPPKNFVSKESIEPVVTVIR